MAQHYQRRDIYPAVHIINIPPELAHSGFIQNIGAICPFQIKADIILSLTFFKKKEQSFNAPDSLLICFTTMISRDEFIKKMKFHLRFELVPGHYSKNSDYFTPDCLAAQQNRYIPQSFKGSKMDEKNSKQKDTLRNVSARMNENVPNFRQKEELKILKEESPGSEVDEKQIVNINMDDNDTSQNIKKTRDNKEIKHEKHREEITGEATKEKKEESQENAKFWDKTGLKPNKIIEVIDYFENECKYLRIIHIDTSSLEFACQAIQKLQCLREQRLDSTFESFNYKIIAKILQEATLSKEALIPLIVAALKMGLEKLRRFIYIESGSPDDLKVQIYPGKKDTLFGKYLEKIGKPFQTINIGKFLSHSEQDFIRGFQVLEQCPDADYSDDLDLVKSINHNLEILSAIFKSILMGSESELFFGKLVNVTRDTLCKLSSTWFMEEKFLEGSMLKDIDKNMVDYLIKEFNNCLHSTDITENKRAISKLSKAWQTCNAREILTRNKSSDLSRSAVDSLRNNLCNPAPTLTLTRRTSETIIEIKIDSLHEGVNFHFTEELGNILQEIFLDTMDKNGLTNLKVVREQYQVDIENEDFVQKKENSADLTFKVDKEVVKESADQTEMKKSEKIVYGNIVCNVNDIELELDLFGVTEPRMVNVKQMQGYTENGEKQKMSDFVSDIKNKLVTVKMAKLMTEPDEKYEIETVFVHEEECFKDSDSETTDSDNYGNEEKKKSVVHFEVENSKKSNNSPSEENLESDEIENELAEPILALSYHADVYPICTLQNESFNEQLEQDLEAFLLDELNKRIDGKNKKKFSQELERNQKTAVVMAKSWRHNGKDFLENVLKISKKSSVDPKNDLLCRNKYPGKSFNKHLCTELTANFIKKQLKKDEQTTTASKRGANKNNLEEKKNSMDKDKRKSCSKSPDSDDQERVLLEEALGQFVASQGMSVSVDEVLLMCESNHVTIKFLQQGFGASQSDYKHFLRYIREHFNRSRNKIDDFAKVLFDFFKDWQSKQRGEKRNKGYQKPPGIPCEVRKESEADADLIIRIKNKKEIEEKQEEKSENKEKMVQEASTQTSVTSETIVNMENTVQGITDKISNMGKEQSDLEERLKSVIIINEKINSLGEEFFDLPNSVSTVENTFEKYKDLCNEENDSWNTWKASIEGRIETLEEEAKKNLKPKRNIVRLTTHENNGEEILVHTDKEGRIPEEAVKALFNDITAMLFQPKEDSPWRMVLFEGGFFHPPDDDWKNRLYFCKRPKRLDSVIEKAPPPSEQVSLSEQGQLQGQFQLYDQQLQEQMKNLYIQEQLKLQEQMKNQPFSPQFASPVNEQLQNYFPQPLCNISPPQPLCNIPTLTGVQYQNIHPPHPSQLTFMRNNF